MFDTYIAKEKLVGVIERLMGRYRVYAPVREGQVHEFAEIKTPGDADLTYRNTRMSPKGLFHPQAELMFQFSLAKDDPEAGILKELPNSFSPTVILGIRPCDARAFRLDDVNFDTSSYRDPWWVRRREGTALIGLACNQPCDTCFCTSVGSGPFDTSGLDVILADNGDGYAANGVTEKGKELLSMIEGSGPVPGDWSSKVDELRKTAESGIPVRFSSEPIAAKSMTELFNADFWDEVQFACINCGVCTFLCPTCWCFDIQDEVHKDSGERLRLWDSCMFPLFTLHGSGHNPRNQKLQRVRQRFMHKLKYYQDKYRNGVACVGCGRCVSACPVNIDIRHVAQLMSAGCTC